MCKYKEFIIQNRPNGFIFEPMAVRLLENESGFGKWTDDVLDALMIQMVQRKVDGMYFFPEQIAETETQIEMFIVAEEWIKNYGCFSLNALRQRFQLRIQNLTDDMPFFEDFLKMLPEHDAYSVVWHPPLPPGKTRLVRAIGANKDIAIEKLVSHIKDIIDEKYTLTEGQLIDYIPALDSTLLATLIKEHLPLVIKKEYDSCVWYCKNEIPIPDDLTEKIASCIQQVEALELPVNENALHLLLSLAYQTNFMQTYGIANTRSFKTLIERHYRGVERRWKGGVFLVESNENSVGQNKVSEK